MRSKSAEPDRAPNLRHGIVRVQVAFECGPPPDGRKFKTAEKSVLSYLAFRCSDKSPNRTWVSVQNIAFHLSTSSDTVSRALASLVNQGLISRKLRNGGTTKSRYTILHWDRIMARRSKFSFDREKSSASDVIPHSMAEDDNGHPAGN
jgi:predicted DNA-binding transcriptional regulator